MPTSRRHLIRCVGGGALAFGASSLVPSVAAGQAGALVIVRTDDGIRALDPRSGSVRPWVGASPVASGQSEPISEPLPVAIATLLTEGAVGYWMASPDDRSHVFRLDTGASSSWWWLRAGDKAVPLDLPGDLEPAFPSGTRARWFHGATIDARHLGAGTLRLLAVANGTGEVVLDHDLDRRLELAATTVSDDGALVAHVQSATTGVTFWAADLRDGARIVEADVRQPVAVAAASAIDLAVAVAGDTALVAAGLAWSWSGAPDPAVTILCSAPPHRVRTFTVSGELLGIVPADCGRHVQETS